MASPSPEVLSTSKPSPEPILRLRKCLIRPYVEGDAEGAAQHADNPAIARWMRDSFPHPYTIEDARRWISIATSGSPTRDFVICRLDGTTVVGSIGLKPRGDIDYRTMGLGYWVGEDHWGQGIATEAVSAFCDWAFEHFDKVLRLEAEVFEGNVGSTRVLEKAGFVLESVKRNAAEKAGVVINVLMYCKLRHDI
jgi:RimJ/RimL family protein N-acetyltransferase